METVCILRPQLWFRKKWARHGSSFLLFFEYAGAPRETHEHKYRNDRLLNKIF